jgi:hypothetical protein
MPDDPKPTSPPTSAVSQQTQQAQTPQTQSSPTTPSLALFTPQDEVITFSDALLRKPTTEKE